MKGVMSPVIGDTWTLAYTPLSPSWIYKIDQNCIIYTPQLNQIANALLNDVNVPIPGHQTCIPLGRI